MSEKKILTRVTFWISIVLLILYLPYMFFGEISDVEEMKDSFLLLVSEKNINSLAFFLYGYCMWFKTYKDLALAIMGSAILGYIMSLIEYSSAKSSTKQQFYNDVITAIHDMQKIVYFDTDVDQKIVIPAIVEYETNEYNEALLDKLKTKPDLYEYEDKMQEIKDSFSNIYKGQFIDYYLSKIGMKNISRSFCEDNYSEILTPYIEKMKTCMQSYIEFSKKEITNIEKDYNSFSFLWNKSYLKKAKTIKDTIWLYKNKVEIPALVFSDYLQTKKKVSRAGSLVLEMNDSFFQKDEDENHVLVTRKEIQDLYMSILELTYNNKNANNAGILNIIVHSEVKLNDKGEPIE